MTLPVILLVMFLSGFSGSFAGSFGYDVLKTRRSKKSPVSIHVSSQMTSAASGLNGDAFTRMAKEIARLTFRDPMAQDPTAKRAREARQRERDRAVTGANGADGASS